MVCYWPARSRPGVSVHHSSVKRARHFWTRKRSEAASELASKGGLRMPSRRDFLKAAAGGGIAATVFGFDLQPGYAQLKELKTAPAAETRSTCPYCAVGCGVLIYTIGDRAKNVTPQVIHVEGHPHHRNKR